MRNKFCDAEGCFVRARAHRSTVVACRGDMKFPFISLHLLQLSCFEATFAKVCPSLAKITSRVIPTSNHIVGVFATRVKAFIVEYKSPSLGRCINAS